MRTVKCGEAVASFGDLGNDFYVIEPEAQILFMAQGLRNGMADGVASHGESLRQGTIEVIISTGQTQAQQGQRGQGKSAAAAAATFSMADRIRRCAIQLIGSLLTFCSIGLP